MLKLDPEDSDADMDDVDRAEKASPTKAVQQHRPPPQPAMPQVDFESSIDNLGSGGPLPLPPPPPVNNALAHNIPTNLSNLSAFVVQNQYNNSGATQMPGPKGRASRGSPKKQQTTTKKGSTAATKKKKRRVSSSEEESDYNSDSDY